MPQWLWCHWASTHPSRNTAKLQCAGHSTRHWAGRTPWPLPLRGWCFHRRTMKTERHGPASLWELILLCHMFGSLSHIFTFVSITQSGQNRKCYVCEHKCTQNVRQLILQNNWKSVSGCFAHKKMNRSVCFCCCILRCICCSLTNTISTARTSNSRIKIGRFNLNMHNIDVLSVWCIKSVANILFLPCSGLLPWTHVYVHICE